jgi:hypothetical protein
MLKARVTNHTSRTGGQMLAVLHGDNPHLHLYARPRRLPGREDAYRDAPDFVEVGEAGIAVDDAMRHQHCLQLVG